MTDHPPPPAVILAGGLARRMGGGDKALLALQGRPLIAHVIDRIAPQAGELAINANGNPARFAPFALPVLPDSVPGHPGPLAGILAALDWAAMLGESQVATVPCDAPGLPGDLLPRLGEAAGEGSAFACHGGRDHPVIGLWRCDQAEILRAALAEGTRAVRDWCAIAGAVACEFPATGPDPFLNINTPADLADPAHED